MKIEPKQVLDVGIGFGRWGMIVREFCDVWYGRVLRQDWQVHIEGIEVFAENISDYHDRFYNKVHAGDARRIMPDLLKSNWDTIIFGDVLEHFEKEEGRNLLNASLVASSYVLVNIPLGEEWPQENIYDNPYEQHLSVWIAEEFKDFHLRRAALFEDFRGRPFGSFILSRLDPKRLALSLFSKNTNAYEFNSSRTYSYLTDAQQQLLAQAEQNTLELERIKNSLTWQIGERINQRIGRSPLREPLRRFSDVVGPPIRRRLARSTENKNSQDLLPIQTAQMEQASETAARPIRQVTPAIFSAEEKAWLAEVSKTKPEAIAVLHSAWRGIRSATLNLFSAYRFVDDTLDEAKALHTARLLAETGCKRVVLSGFPVSHRYLVTSLHKISPQVKVYVLWHGSFLQSHEDYAWQGFRLIQELCQDGLIYKWGFVKKGMAEVMAKTGVRTGFILNYVENIPPGPSVPLEGGPHLGIWGLVDNWRKLPYAMIASTVLIPGAKVHGSAITGRTREFAQAIGVHWEGLNEDLIPQNRMSTVMAQMHLNLYVTLSECAPMLPLESLSVGAPCLLGPNSHLFEDHEYLHEILVVPYPDSAKIIAEHAIRALAERGQIIEAYREYAPDYNKRAQQTLAEFLEL